MATAGLANVVELPVYPRATIDATACTSCAPNAEFSLHGTFKENLTSITTIANLERKMIKNSFQVSNLG